MPLLRNGPTSRCRSRRSANASRQGYEPARTASSPFHSHSSSRRRTVRRQEPAAMVKIVVGKVSAVEFAVRRTAGKAAATHMAHAMAAEAAADVAAA